MAGFDPDGVEFSSELVNGHVLFINLFFQELQPSHLAIHVAQLGVTFDQFLTGLIEFFIRTCKLIPHKDKLLLRLSFPGLSLVQLLLDVVVTVVQGLDLECEAGELGLLFAQLLQEVVFDLV